MEEKLKKLEKEGLDGPHGARLSVCKLCQTQKLRIRIRFLYKKREIAFI
jgi:hypothetical protein